MRIENRDERDSYENEAIRSNWNVNTLKRQFHSSLYERLALSRDKNDVMRLANEGAVPQKPQDILHTPYVLEFAGLEDRAYYHESDLESYIKKYLHEYLEKRLYTFDSLDDLKTENRYRLIKKKLLFTANFLACQKGGWTVIVCPFFY